MMKMLVSPQKVPVLQATSVQLELECLSPAPWVHFQIGECCWGLNAVLASSGISFLLTIRPTRTPRLGKPWPEKAEFPWPGKAQTGWGGKRVVR